MRFFILDFLYQTTHFSWTPLRYVHYLIGQNRILANFNEVYRTLDRLPRVLW